jgi:hypothetical protein
LFLLIFVFFVSTFNRFFIGLLFDELSFPFHFTRRLLWWIID